MKAREQAVHASAQCSEAKGPRLGVRVLAGRVGRAHLAHTVLPNIKDSCLIVQNRPSPSYHLRDQKGKLEAQFIARRIEPLQVPTQNHCDKKRVDVLLYPDQQTSAYRYQFEKLAGKAAVQDERIDIMAELLVHQNNLGELQHPCLPRQEECATVGKICCDAFEGKLNPSSLLLEVHNSRFAKVCERIFFP